MKYNLPRIIYEYPTDEWIAEQVFEHCSVTKRFKSRIVKDNALKIYYRTIACESQNWKCCWCGVVMTEQRDFDHSATIEHIIPKCEGGLDEPENYAASCYRCNMNRGTKSVEEFMQDIELELHITNDVMNRKKKKIEIAQEKSRTLARRRQPPIKGDHGDNFTHFNRYLAQIAFMRHPNYNPFDEGSPSWLRFEKYTTSPFRDVIGDRIAAKAIKQTLEKQDLIVLINSVEVSHHVN